MPSFCPSFTFLFVFFLACVSLATAEYPAIHLTLHRRGDRFATHDEANLARLAGVLAEVETLYAKAERIIEGNRLGHRWKSRGVGTTIDEGLINAVGQDGTWFHPLRMSDSLQLVELDIDMLSPDFYISTTTSSLGSQYNAFVSSHLPSGERVHPLCQYPTDVFHLTQTPGQPPRPINLTFPMCSPSHSHSLTLSSSGALLGLSPPTTQLSRLTSPPLLTQLHTLNLIPSKIFSITLLTHTTALLTLGSTIASHVSRASISTELSLANFGNPLFTPEHIASLVDAEMSRSFPQTLEDQFHWVKVSGPKGRWTTLLSGVWVGGSKVLKNQPVLLDVNCPFILAPPLSATAFWESVGGAQKLGQAEWSRNRNGSGAGFWKFPCLNKVNVAWEFSGKMFPAFKEGGREELLFGPAGGAMSLGMVRGGDGKDGSSGYCVGVVVESAMGVEDLWKNSGMKDVWVLGEPFFRGLGVVFDPEIEGERIGLRNY